MQINPEPLNPNPNPVRRPEQTAGRFLLIFSVLANAAGPPVQG